MFVIAKHALADLTENIVETWIKPRSDKFVKKEGKKYFETTDDDPLVLTFRQFVNYLTQISSEMMYGKVREISVAYITLFYIVRFINVCNL